ncbi:cupin domain-containing protein [Mycobacterium sp. 852002-51057_SCH5723018]|uniref:cupin domain-containing protein n=1 Tax=Mycobacterium sp. 852002-51057_SCH5723018 TaxID=1834094 RepID=UPI000ACD8B92
MRLVIKAAASAIAVATLCAPVQAAATPARGIESVLLNQSSLDGRDYITRDITIAPGGSTGWHWHDGELVGVVKQGTLTHNASNCSVDGVYNAGDAVVEPAGADHVHIGRNLGAVPTILQVIYVDPPGTPLAVDAPNPGCDFD